MLLLDAVNLIMPKLGERPVTSLDVKHPTLAVLLPIIEQKRRECLLDGWWFNEYDYIPLLDVNGKIAMGTQTLRFIPDAEDTAVLRGTYLFNLKTLTDVFTSSVPGKITQDVVFDELPESAANFVFYSALVDAYGTDIGVTQEIGLWQTMAASAASDLLSEHLKQKKYSSRKTRAWQKYRRSLMA